jgi:hypothetical protein
VFLTEGIADPFLKVKIIHDWMINNIRYDYTAYDTGNITAQSAGATLKYGKAVCSGYASLFKIMYEMTVVPCQLLASAVGRSKFLSSASFDPDFFMILKKIPELLFKENKVWRSHSRNAASYASLTPEYWRDTGSPPGKVWLPMS